MKLVAYGPTYRVGTIVRGSVVDIELAERFYLEKGRGGKRRFEGLRTVADLISGGEAALSRASQVTEYAIERPRDGKANGVRIVSNLEDVKLQPPMPSPGSVVVCAVTNFVAHYVASRGLTFEEGLESLRKNPLTGFLKTNRGFVGDGDRVMMPARSKELDYEVELAAVIGRRTKDAQEQNALDYVFGYTGLIDYSLRDQSPNNPSMLANKNFDGCGALGPCIVTKDEVPDPQRVSLELKVNGQIRQSGTTADMVRPYSELIAWFSRDLTLEAGDLVSGGTCSGTANEKKNSMKDWSWFLKPGDRIESTVGNIGTIRNEIVSKQVVT